MLGRQFVRRAGRRYREGFGICWGDLGGCADEVGTAPAPAVSIGTVKHLARSYSGCFWCALRLTGDVDCTETFAGTAVTRRLQLAPAVALAAAGPRACALLADGKVMCWLNGGGDKDTDPTPVEW